MAFSIISIWEMICVKISRLHILCTVLILALALTLLSSCSFASVFSGPDGKTAPGEESAPPAADTTLSEYDALRYFILPSQTRPDKVDLSELYKYGGAFTVLRSYGEYLQFLESDRHTEESLALDEAGIKNYDADFFSTKALLVFTHLGQGDFDFTFEAVETGEDFVSLLIHQRGPLITTGVLRAFVASAGLPLEELEGKQVYADMRLIDP